MVTWSKSKKDVIIYADETAFYNFLILPFLVIYVFYLAQEIN